jgi:predicted lipoprotein with Yx(FWY)xxD motif
MIAIRYVAGYAATGTAVLALTLAGCGGGGGGSSGSSKSGTSPSQSSGGTTQSGTTGSATSTLTTAKVAKLGTVVTDDKGYVLYRFDADSANPTKVTCYSTCAALWPAATTTGKGSVTTKGIDKSMVSTVKRNDGSTQITLAGWPLYRYAKDDEPKEPYGQGVDGTWWAVTPSGAKITTPASTSSAPAPATTGTGGGGGY